MVTSSDVTRSRRSTHASCRVVAVLLIAALGAGWTSACVNPTAALTRLLEARRLTSNLHVAFTKAADAANRAVMAETDDASTNAAEEARRETQAVGRNIEALHPVLQSLGYSDDVHYLDEFKARFDEYRRLDDEILPLAVENTNLKAQRLSFGPAREAAEAFRASIDGAVHTAATRDICRVDAVAARAGVALLEMQATHARHIAAGDDPAMTQMETQMTASATTARRTLEELQAMLTPAARSQLAAAGAALDRFMSIHAEIVALSRRNSNVRSLALSLGRKRMVTAACEDQLRALEETLAKHEFTATR